LIGVLAYPEDPLGGIASALIHDAADFADTKRKRKK